jgi:hypothetical protein
MLTALILLATIASGYDASTSLRRFKKYGPPSELNPLTKLLCRIVGPENGMYASILVPHIMWSLVCWLDGWTLAYAIYAGYMFKGFLMQVASLQLEKELDELSGR